MQSDKVTFGAVVGVGTLIMTTGVPAMVKAGHTAWSIFPPDWSLPLCLAVAMLGGAVGGAFLGEKHYIAGCLGGLLAGPCNYLSVYFYCLHRDSIHHHECAIVQLVGSLPGLGLYYFLKRRTSNETQNNHEFDRSDENWSDEFPRFE